MKWFGKDWGAPVCSNPHVPTPVGMTCYLCRGKPIQEGDQGIYFDDAVTGTPENPRFKVLAAHLQCFKRSFTKVSADKLN